MHVQVAVLVNVRDEIVHTETRGGWVHREITSDIAANAQFQLKMPCLCSPITDFKSIRKLSLSKWLI